MSNAENLQSFQVTSLDTSGISESDLQGRRRWLLHPGVYDLKIEEFKLSASEKLKDAAGKQWGSIYLLASQVGTGYSVRGFVSVPMETLVHTSRGGSQSKIKTKIFCDFIESLTGNRPALNQIQDSVVNLANLLQDGVLTASVGYNADHVSYVGKNDEGQSLFTIMHRDGSRMLDSEGNELTFSGATVTDENGQQVELSGREEAVRYYESIKGFSPAQNMTLLGFRKTRVGESNGSED